MSRLPQSSENPRRQRAIPWVGTLALLAVFTTLAAYLHQPVQATGDGAAYVLQALDGSPWERSVHAGYLAPLWAVVGRLGVPPNLFSSLWIAVGLCLATALGTQLCSTLPTDPRLPPSSARLWAPLLAPASLLCSRATWESALFVEVYGPLAVLLAGSLLMLLRRQDLLAGLLAGWAVLVHPGAWALLPGLWVFSGGRSVKRALRVVGIAALLHGVAWFFLLPDWWSGGRGLATLPTMDRSPWESLQGGWRLVSRGMGAASVCVLAGLLASGRRQLWGLALTAGGAALFMDRFSDNPGQLTTLWLLCCLAPLGIRWWEALDDRRLQTTGTVAMAALLVLGVAEATSQHDARARQELRKTEALVAGGCQQAEPPDWSDRMRWRLACRASLLDEESGNRPGRTGPTGAEAEDPDYLGR